MNTDSTNAPGSVRLDEAPRLSIKTEYIFGSDLFVKLNSTNSETSRLSMPSRLSMLVKEAVKKLFFSRNNA